MEIMSAAKTGWIYNFADYKRIYDLSESDLQKRIFDFPSGASSFNQEASLHGMNVVSGDPAYRLIANEMTSYVKELFDSSFLHLQETRLVLKENDEVALNQIASTWQKTIDTFLADYQKGRTEGRYQAVNLPGLPYQDHHFEMALCSDLFFNEMFTANETWQSMLNELLRVALEIRIFPLLDEKGQATPILGPLILYLQERQLGVEVREVPYNMKKGGNAMLRVWSQQCLVT